MVPPGGVKGGGIRGGRPRLRGDSTLTPRAIQPLPQVKTPSSVAKAKKRIAQAVESGHLNRKRAKEVLARLTLAAEKVVKSTHAGG